VDSDAGQTGIVAESHSKFGLASLFHAKARTGTLRRHLITLPARIARRSRRITLRLPLNWPHRDAFNGLFTTTHAPPHRT
jgi:hypothetical protein